MPSPRPHAALAGLILTTLAAAAPQQAPGGQEAGGAESPTEAAPPEDEGPNLVEALAAARNARAARLFEEDRPAAEVAWRTALERTVDFLRAQPFSRFPPGPRVELTWLRRWCEVELALSERRSWRLDPSWHVHRLTTVLEAAPGREAPAEAWIDYARLVEATPAALLAAREELTLLQPEFVPQGADAARALARALAPTLADRAARAGLQGPALTALGEHCRRGRRAADAFAAWLGGAESSSVGTALVGRDAWLILARAAAGRDLDVEDMEVALARVVASVPKPSATGENGEAGEAPATEATPRAVALGDATHVVETAARVADTVVNNLGLLPEPGPILTTRSSPTDLPIGPAVMPRRGAGGTWELALVPPGPAWPEEARAIREAALGAEGLAAAALVYGSPGSGWLATHGRRGLPELSTFPDPVGLEAWGLFAARWLIEIGPESQALRTREGLDVELGRLRLEAAARALASLELHVKRRSFEEVRVRLQGHTGWDDWTVEQELAAALSDPGRGLAILGTLELESLWDRWTPQIGRETALKRILAALRGHPRARASDLEALFE